MTIPAQRTSRAFNDIGELIDTIWPPALGAAAGVKRGILAHIQGMRTDAARNLVDDTTAQAVFPTTHDAVTVSAGQQYRFRAAYRITKGANSVSYGTLFAGTATFTTINYLQTTGHAASGTTVAANINNGEVATVVAGVAGTGVNYRILLEGEFEVLAGGTVIPQVVLSGASGATPAVSVGSWFECWPEGVNPVTAIGNVA